MKPSRYIFLACFTILFNTICWSGKPAKSAPKTLKILSYNIRNCKGLDNVTDYQRTADVIRRIDADFVALQELDSVTQRSKGIFVLNELASKTKMYPTYRASISYQGGKYGIGILTREKPLKTEAIALPGKEEPRSLLIVEMKDYVFCCTHLSLTHEDRIASVALINKAVEHYSKPVFLAGDMNAVARSIEITDLAKNWHILTNPAKPTIPANEPKDCIDYIFAKKNKNYRFNVIKSVVENEPVASDHLPVWVEVSLNIK